jgi:hypothetical protein
VCPRRGFDGDAEPLGQLVPRGYRQAGRVGPAPDLVLQDLCYLEVARDSGEVVKIIGHTATLVDQVEYPVSGVSLVKLVSCYSGSVSIRTWEDTKRDELAALFPSHDIWTVRNPVCRHTTWCSRPKGSPTATINANSADELQSEIAEELAAACDQVE